MTDKLEIKMTEPILKRGTRIEYTYAAGKVVSGKILGRYAAMDGWYRCQLTDEAGNYGSGCHVDQLRVVDNR